MRPIELAATREPTLRVIKESTVIAAADTVVAIVDSNPTLRVVGLIGEELVSGQQIGVL